VKVLQITRDYTNNGGIGRYVQDVTSSLRDAGHDVAVICAEGPAGPDLGDVHVIPGCDEFEHAEGSRNREAVLERGVTFGPDLVMLHAMDDYALEIELRARHRVARFIHNHAYCPSGIDHAPASAHPCDRTQGASCVGGFLTRRCWFVRNPVTATHFYRRAAAAVANMRTAPLLFTASRYVRERVVRQGVDPRRLSWRRTSRSFRRRPSHQTRRTGRRCCSPGASCPKKACTTSCTRCGTSTRTCAWW